MHETTSGLEPDIGDIVHYRSRGSSDGKFPPVCVAAAVTKIWTTVHHGTTPDETSQFVGLAVLNPAGLFFQDRSPQDEERTHGGTWHWKHEGDE
jgi:hypothetical protein